MKYKSYGTIIMITLFLCGMVIYGRGVNVYASSAMIEFSLDKTDIGAGDTFTVITTVTGSENISAVDAYVTYDAALMTYVSGGKYVTGGDGLLHIIATGLSGEKNRVKFSLQFKAAVKGDGVVGIADQASVSSAAGEVMSSSSNRVSVSIKGEGQSVGADGDGAGNTVAPQPTPELSSDNRLNSLLVSSGVLEPEFSPDVTKYTLTVDNNTGALYFSYKTSDKDAVVSFSGNESLVEGKNKVKVKVRAPNNDVKVYSIIVMKETEEETRTRELAENNEGSGIGFSITQENGEVFLRNNYEFRIVDVPDSSLIPAGFVKTSVRLYGVNVTAYTIANDLDNDYLLMYCMNANGDKDFYQFDRQEKSLQRYSGDLIERVNSSDMPESSDVMTAREYKNNLNQLAIIIAILAAVSVLLVICIISILLKQIKSRSGRTEDELDF